MIKGTKKMVKSIIEKQAKISANSTTCVALYQPKPLYQLRQDALAERQIIGINFGLLPKRR